MYLFSTGSNYAGQKGTCLTLLSYVDYFTSSGYIKTVHAKSCIGLGRPTTTRAQHRAKSGFLLRNASACPSMGRPGGRAQALPGSLVTGRPTRSVLLTLLVEGGRNKATSQEGTYHA